MLRYIDKISGGENKELPWQELLLIIQKILIADEPTGNLDAANEQNIIELLKMDQWGVRYHDYNSNLHSDKVANSMQSICTVVDGKIEYVREMINESFHIIQYKRDLEVNKRRYRLVPRLSIWSLFCY